MKLLSFLAILLPLIITFEANQDHILFGSKKNKSLKPKILNKKDCC